MNWKLSFTRWCFVPAFLPRFCLLCIVCLSLKEILSLVKVPYRWTYQHARVPHTTEVRKVSAASRHNICVKQCHTLCWCRSLPRAMLVFPGFDWMRGGGLLCSNFCQASGHTQPVCHPLICLAYHFMIHIKSCGSMVKAIMNYLVNRGRFTDDWSMCGENKHRGKEKCDTSVFLWNTGSGSRNKAGVHHLDSVDFSCRFGHNVEDGNLFLLIFFCCFSNLLIQ